MAANVWQSMANPNPSAARAAKRRKAQARKVGDVEAVRGILWRVLQRIETATAKPAGEAMDADTLAAVRLLPQLAGVYLKSIEVGEVVARIEALEKGEAIE